MHLAPSIENLWLFLLSDVIFTISFHDSYQKCGKLAILFQRHKLSGLKSGVSCNPSILQNGLEIIQRERWDFGTFVDLKEIWKCHSLNDQFRKYICLTNLNSRATVWNMIWMPKLAGIWNVKILTTSLISKVEYVSMMDIVGVDVDTYLFGKGFVIPFSVHKIHTMRGEGGW